MNYVPFIFNGVDVVYQYTRCTSITSLKVAYAISTIKSQLSGDIWKAAEDSSRAMETRVCLPELVQTDTLVLSVKLKLLLLMK